MTRSIAWPFACMVAAGLALAGCHARSDSHANAPGQPGTGNGVATSAPLAADSQPGGPSGIKGSAPHTASSGGDMLPGTSGRGTADASGRSEVPQPGVGLNGGIASANGANAAAGANGTSSMGAGALEGSTNSTSKNAVGQR